MKIELDEFQTRILETDGNICVRSGRQIGKSTVISVKAGEYAIKNAKKTVLVIAATERQAYLLFEKVLAYLEDNYKSYIKKGKDRPTKSKIMLRNGSKVLCLPTGMSGVGIRGYTVDLLIADEAAFIPEEVWTAVTPMLSVTKGDIILLSTPHGKEGFYYDCFQNPAYTSFHRSSEDCPRVDKDFLAREKMRMTKVQYAQEYLGEFIDELRQFFPSDLIRQCMEHEKIKDNFDYHKFMGVDVARMGNDETVLASVYKLNDRIILFDLDIMKKVYLSETAAKIMALDKKHKYKRIYIDDGGLGVGVFDFLLQQPDIRRKIEAINNSARSIDNEDKKRKKLLKEDLYTNLLRLMEQGKLRLYRSDEIFLSLKSIQYEYTEDKRIKIFGNYSHITEALIRAAWATKEKHLSIWIQ